MSPGLPAKGEDRREERKGPRVGAPEAALAGFLKSAGLTRIEDAEIREDAKKGSFYVAVIDRPGRPTPEVLAGILPEIIRNFPWPKSMRWGAQSAQAGALTWVRPLRSILCTFGPETERAGDRAVFASVKSNPAMSTHGHRFHAPEPIHGAQARRLPRGAGQGPGRRRQRPVAAGSSPMMRATSAFAQGLTLVEDDALLEEAAGGWWNGRLCISAPSTRPSSPFPTEVIRATIPGQPEMLRARRAGRQARQPVRAGCQYRRE